MPRCRRSFPILPSPNNGPTLGYCLIQRTNARRRRRAPCSRARLRAGAGWCVTTTSRGRSSARMLAARLQHLLKPIPHIGRADALVVDLAVVITTLLAREDLHRLLLRANGVKALVRLAQRNLLIAP